MTYLQLKFQSTSQMGNAAYYVTERHDRIRPRTLLFSMVPTSVKSYVGGRRVTYFLGRIDGDGTLYVDAEDTEASW